MAFKRGDFVRVRRTGDEEWTPGWVAIAAQTGQSIGIFINGNVRAAGGIITGFLPLLVDPKTGVITGLIGTDTYDVEKV
jgi:hypothetical protein